MASTTSPVRHAVVRSTGATTWARKDGDQWKITCLNHGQDGPTAESRGKAWKTASHPHEWCTKCKSIAAGKADKISEGKLDLPKPTAKTTRAKKAAAPTTKTEA